MPTFVLESGTTIRPQPFVTLESMVENLQTAVLLARAGKTNEAIERTEYVVERSGILWNELTYLLPEEYRRTEGEYPFGPDWPTVIADE